MRFFRPCHALVLKICLVTSQFTKLFYYRECPNITHWHIQSGDTLGLHYSPWCKQHVFSIIIIYSNLIKWCTMVNKFSIEYLNYNQLLSVLVKCLGELQLNLICQIGMFDIPTQGWVTVTKLLMCWLWNMISILFDDATSHNSSCPQEM